MVHGIGSAATRSISINRDTLEQRRMFRDVRPLSNAHVHIHTRAFLRDYRFEAVYIIFSVHLFILLLLSAKVRIYFFFFYLCFSLIARVSDSHPDTF